MDQNGRAPVRGCATGLTVPHLPLAHCTPGSARRGRQPVNAEAITQLHGLCVQVIRLQHHHQAGGGPVLEDGAISGEKQAVLDGCAGNETLVGLAAHGRRGVMASGAEPARKADQHLVAEYPAGRGGGGVGYGHAACMAASSDTSSRAASMTSTPAALSNAFSEMYRRQARAPRTP